VGDTEVQVGVRQGTPSTETFQTDGSANQRYLLASKVIDRLSVEVVTDGVIWTQVDSFISYESTDRVYLVEIDGDGNVEVVFGDNFNGLAPSASSINNLSIHYLVSDGSEGNVGISTITNILDTLLDVDSVAVSVAVTNLQAATGGADEETLDHAREQAPAELSSLFRAMTKTDYESLLEGFPGIQRASVWGEQDENPPDYNLYNWVLMSFTPTNVTRADLVADPVNNGQPSGQLKTDVLAYLEERKCVTTRLKIVDPVYIAVDVEANVYYTSGSLSSTVKADVEDAIIGFFDPDTMPFGQEIRRSNIVRLMDATVGVSYVDLTKLTTDASPTDLESSLEHKRYEKPFLRTLTVTIAKAVDTPLRAEVYPLPPAPPAPPEEQ
jgi:predicted phage baseplate assembly protein